MVKQIVEIEKNKSNLVNIFPNGVLILDSNNERNIKSKQQKTLVFIEKAKIIHKDKYDYSKTVYGKNNREEVVIICPIHGEFEQKPSYHLDKCGCQSCGGSIKLTSDIFIRKAVEKHGYTYNYSQVNYVNAFEKIEIICPIHGIFKQTPNAHLNGQGCKKCGIITRSNIRKNSFHDFVKNAIEVHGSKYEYPFFDYKNNHQQISIICPIHGEFKQTPHSHTDQKSGCKKCGIDSSKNKRIKNIEEFIKESKDIHGYKYDYSKVTYKGDRVLVVIICPIHGKFEQAPHEHVQGRGCRKCGRNMVGNKLKKDTQWFILESVKIHRNKYDYSKVAYGQNSNVKTTIICPIHGEFKQSPHLHIYNKLGCRKCAPKSKGEIEVYRILENMSIFFKQWYRPVGCINPITKYKLEFDFYIEKYNLYIEFDGQQHFKPWKGKETEKYINRFKQIQYLDSIKTQYCLDNKINLLRIHYKDFKNIEKLILEAIEKIKASETGYVTKLY